MIKDTPILSFCIPTWNRAERVYNCVTHILKSDYKNIEVVVSNNASTDNTLELLHSINDSRLKIFTNTMNIASLNWPLAVSRASGQWAALMSDEDFVELDNMQYFMNLLNAVDKDEIGAILYDFAPIKRVWGEHISLNVYDSLVQAHSSVHITAHILNMRFLNFQTDLEEYYYSISSINYFEDIKRKHRAEPQHELLLSVAEKKKVMLTDIALCAFGKDEVAEKHNVKVCQFSWNGMSADYRETCCKAFYLHLANAMPSMRNHSYEQVNKKATITTFLTRLTIQASCWYMGVVYGADHLYRPAIIRQAQEYYKYTHEQAAEMLLLKLLQYIEYCKPDTDCDYFKSIQKHLPEVLRGNIRQRFAFELSVYERVMLGSYLFSTYIAFTGFWNGFDQVRFYKEDFEDILELKKTNEMYRLLKEEHDYNSVIDYPDVIVSRADYLKGLAHFARADYSEAIKSLNGFVQTIENSKKIEDIMVSSMWVQHAYYYLAKAYQELGSIKKAVENYTKCNELTNSILIGDRLVPKLLNIGSKN